MCLKLTHQVCVNLSCNCSVFGITRRRRARRGRLGRPRSSSNPYFPLLTFLFRRRLVRKAFPSSFTPCYCFIGSHACFLLSSQPRQQQQQFLTTTTSLSLSLSRSHSLCWVD